MFGKRTVYHSIGGTIAVLLAIYASSCTSGAMPVVPANLPVSIEGLHGKSDVSTTASFQYSFSNKVDESTVNGQTFFIVQTPSASASISAKAEAIDSSICDSGNAIDATISCYTFTQTSCTLSPTNALAEGTSYSACLTTGITYSDGSSFGGYMATFTTEGSSNAVVLSDADGHDLSSTTTGINPSILTVTFGRTISDTDAAADAISMSCGDMSPTLDVSCADTTCSVSVEDAWRYAMMDCTLTVGTEAGLSEAASYTFTNKCALSDDFNADTHTCWGASTLAGDEEWTTWDELLNVFTFDSSNSTLNFDVSGGATDSEGGFMKSISIAPDVSELGIIVHIASVSGMDTEGVDKPGDGVAAIIFDSGFSTSLIVGMFAQGSGRVCSIIMGDGSGSSTLTADCSASGEYYVKFYISSDGTEEFQYSTDGINYSNLSLNDGDSAISPASEILAEANIFTYGMLYGFTADGDVGADIDSVQFTGISGANDFLDQY